MSGDKLKRICAVALQLVVPLMLLAQHHQFNVMTLNLRYDTDSDKENAWRYRKEAVADVIKKYKPVFAGIQEGLHHQVTYLDSALTRYHYIGVGRDDGDTSGEYSALFYDASKYKVEKSGTFWLSETPDKVSYGWGAKFHRICTYGLFVNERNHEKFWVFNSHFDHETPEARKQSAYLIMRKVAEVTTGEQWPLIIMGDFNATPDQEPIRILDKYLDDDMAISDTPPEGPSGTFNGFQPGTPDRRIDYIFSRRLSVHAYQHVDLMRKDGGFISDHLPVVATFRPE